VIILVEHWKCSKCVICLCVLFVKEGELDICPDCVVKHNIDVEKVKKRIEEFLK